MNKIIITFICLLMVSLPSMADEFTELGKITFTAGHISPACRTVRHQENATGVNTDFRIPNTGGDDIGAVALAALLSSRDVIIRYNPLINTGCGTEPQIINIRIF